MKIDTDFELAVKVTSYLTSHPDASRNELKKKLKTSVPRLELLDKQGLIRLPKPLSKSMAATLGRKKHGLMDGWYINKPTVWS